MITNPTSAQRDEWPAGFEPRAIVREGTILTGFLSRDGQWHYQPWRLFETEIKRIDTRFPVTDKGSESFVSACPKPQATRIELMDGTVLWTEGERWQL